MYIGYQYFVLKPMYDIIKNSTHPHNPLSIPSIIDRIHPHSIAPLTLSTLTFLNRCRDITYFSCTCWKLAIAPTCNYNDNNVTFFSLFWWKKCQTLLVIYVLLYHT